MGETSDWVLKAGTVVRKSSEIKPEELEELARHAKENGAELVIDGGSDGDTSKITPQITVVSGLPAPKK